jgi:hypothetical protein
MREKRLTCPECGNSFPVSRLLVPIRRKYICPSCGTKMSLSKLPARRVAAIVVLLFWVALVVLGAYLIVGWRRTALLVLFGCLLGVLFLLVLGRLKRVPVRARSLQIAVTLAIGFGVGGVLLIPISSYWAESEGLFLAGMSLLLLALLTGFVCIAMFVAAMVNKRGAVRPLRLLPLALLFLACAVMLFIYGFGAGYSGMELTFRLCLAGAAMSALLFVLTVAATIVAASAKRNSSPKS